MAVIPRLCRAFALSALFLCLIATAHAQPRIKDLVDFEGVRANDLVGYGLVVGLNGTGDSVRNSPYTEEALVSLLERLGINVQGERLQPRNVAAVLVTSTLPAFARAGSSIDVNIAAIGDADSLLGGTLIMTPLKAADGRIYAVAQGTVLASGFNAQGAAAEVTSGVPTAATIPNGARVEREVAFALNELRSVRLALRDPDFTTAARIEQRINGQLGSGVAFLLDPGTVELRVPDSYLNRVAHFLSNIENLTVRPEQAARVVVDQRSGTIVMGADVRVSTVAVTQGNLTVRVTETPQVVQPNPFGEGETVVVPRTGVEVDEGAEQRIAIVESGTTLAQLVEGLNALGIGPRDMIDILSNIKAAGALHAELVVR